MRTGRAFSLACALAAAVLAVDPAVAFWTSAGSGTGSGLTGTLAPPTNVTAQQGGTASSVRVTWVSSAAPGGGPVDGYTVQRLTGSTPVNACGTSSSSPLPGTATTCDDTGLASGTYTYRVTALYRTWTAPSVPSPPFTLSTVVAPTVTSIVRADSPATQTGNGTLRWTVTFSEAVTGVDTADFALVVSGLGGTPAITGVSGSGATRTVTASTGNGSGTLGLNLVDNDTIVSAASGTALGGAGAGNGNATGPAYTLNRTIASVSLLNGSGGTAGRIDQGDRIVIRFSRAMQPSSFCSAWTDLLGVPLDLGGNGVVTVTVTDGSAGNDTLTVSSGGCLGGFKFGSIDLGSPNYLAAGPGSQTFSGTQTFSGNGNNASTISYDRTTFTLTVVLGRASTTGGTVASSAPVYTADPAIRASDGSTVSNSPFALPAGAQF